MHHSSLLYLEELASEHPKTLKAKLEFANAEQLLEWYQREDGENVFMQCSKAKSFKQAWKGYAMEYNKKKAASF